MARRIKKLLCILLAALLLTSCSAPAVTDVLDNGASDFAAGKTEENYYLRNSALLLDELIAKYSGSYQPPISVQVPSVTPPPTIPSTVPPTGPAGETAPAETTPPETIAPDATAPTEGPQIPEVGSWSDFLRVMHEAYIRTEEYLEFRFVNGYAPADMPKCLLDSFTELQREDPIYVSCVERWDWSPGDPVTMKITYTMNPAELIAIKDATAALVDEAVRKLDVQGKSDYEIVCAVNQHLIDISYYPPKPYAPETHTAYGALKNGVAVCEGYACAAKLMLNKFGIRTDIQVGTCTNGEGHAWNLVELDGVWYQLDVTWNDTSGISDAFLLVNDDYMLKSRTWDSTIYPACPYMYTK